MRPKRHYCYYCLLLLLVVSSWQLMLETTQISGIIIIKMCQGADALGQEVIKALHIIGKFQAKHVKLLDGLVNELKVGP